MRRGTSFRIVLPVAGVLLLAAVGAVTTMISGDFLGLGAKPGPPGAQSSLEHSVPDPREPNGENRPYTEFTAEELNRAKQASDLRPIRFVDAGEESTGPDVVSVNPIDAFTWGAAARSTQDGRCYVIVAIADQVNPRFGEQRYGTLPQKLPCIGGLATREYASSDYWPEADS